MKRARAFFSARVARRNLLRPGSRVIEGICYFLTISLPLGSILLLGCGTQGAPLPPSANIPKAITDLHATRKGDTVTLTWTAPEETTDGALVTRPGKMIARRTTSDNPNASVIGELPLVPVHKSQQARAQTFKGSLTDLLRNNSANFATYTVEALSSSGKTAGPSNPAEVPLVPVPAPPGDLQLKVVPEGVSISWMQTWPPQNKTGLGTEYVYRIMRRQADSKQQPILVKQLNAGNAAAMVIDTAMEWEKQYQYWVTPVTLWQNGDQQKGEVEGEDSQPVTIITHDIFPPAVPTGLQAVYSQVGQNSFIDLTWIPNQDPDLAGYNVYRRTEGTQQVKINNDLVKTPAFRDDKIQPGTRYFYSVSAVDLRGNESAKSQEASETVPQ